MFGGILAADWRQNTSGHRWNFRPTSWFGAPSEEMVPESLWDATGMLILLNTRKCSASAFNTFIMQDVLSNRMELRCIDPHRPVFLAEQDVQVLSSWPAQSPDLSVIENMWQILKEKIFHRNPRTHEDLWGVAAEEWNNIPRERIRSLHDSIPRWLNACVAAKGGHTKYWVDGTFYCCLCDCYKYILWQQIALLLHFSPYQEKAQRLLDDQLFKMFQFLRYLPNMITHSYDILYAKVTRDDNWHVWSNVMHKYIKVKWQYTNLCFIDAWRKNFWTGLYYEQYEGIHYV